MLTLHQLRNCLSRADVVVLVGMLVLVVALVPCVVKESGQDDCRIESLNQLKQMMLAVHNCHDVYRRLPPSVGVFPQNEHFEGNGTDPLSSGTLLFFLLPYIEEEPLYRAARVNSLEGAGPHVVKTYYCPMDPTLPATYLDAKSGYALTSYAVNWYAFRGAPYTSSKIEDRSACTSTRTLRDSFPDGLGNTIALMERYAVCWTSAHLWADDRSEPGVGSSPIVIYSALYPASGLRGDELSARAYPDFARTPGRCDPAGVQAMSYKGIQIAVMDGSARLVTAEISESCWRNALTPDGGEQLDNTW
jgi:hypothetical protein